LRSRLKTLSDLSIEHPQHANAREHRRSFECRLPDFDWHNLKAASTLSAALPLLAIAG
jgi:hypothetical protein